MHEYYERKIYKAKSETLDEVEDESITTRFQYCKAVREGRPDDARELAIRINDLEERLERIKKSATGT